MTVLSLLVVTLGLAASIVGIEATAAFAATRTDNLFDYGFTPLHRLRVPQGGRVGWYAESGNVHDRVLTSFFFASPNIAPGTWYFQWFNGAGNLTITDSPSADTMTVGILPVLSATTGTCDTPFIVQGGVKAQHGTQSFVHTYQVLTPGGSWQVIGKKNINKLSVSYTPGADCTVGTYKFRVRSTLPTDYSQRSDWSPGVEATVAR